MPKLPDLRTVPISFCEYEKLAGKWQMFMHRGVQVCAHLSAISYDTLRKLEQGIGTIGSSAFKKEPVEIETCIRITYNEEDTRGYKVELEVKMQSGAMDEREQKEINSIGKLIPTDVTIRQHLGSEDGSGVVAVITPKEDLGDKRRVWQIAIKEYGIAETLAAIFWMMTIAYMIHHKCDRHTDAGAIPIASLKKAKQEVAYGREQERLPVPDWVAHPRRGQEY